jgi:hypothetical protein
LEELKKELTSCKEKINTAKTSIDSSIAPKISSKFADLREGGKLWPIGQEASLFAGIETIQNYISVLTPTNQAPELGRGVSYGKEDEVSKAIAWDQQHRQHIGQILTALCQLSEKIYGLMSIATQKAAAPIFECYSAFPTFRAFLEKNHRDYLESKKEKLVKVLSQSIDYQRYMLSVAAETNPSLWSKDFFAFSSKNPELAKLRDVSYTVFRTAFVGILGQYSKEMISDYSAVINKELGSLQDPIWEVSKDEVLRCEARIVEITELIVTIESLQNDLGPMDYSKPKQDEQKSETVISKITEMASGFMSFFG